MSAVVEVQKEKTNNIARLSNEMARAKLPVKSIYDARIIVILAAKIKKDDEDFKFYELKLDEVFSEVKRGGKEYDAERLRFMANSLLNMKMEVKEDNNSFMMFNPFIDFTYQEDQKVFLCRFHPNLREHLIKLKKYFTKIPLKTFLQLKGIYTQKLFLYLWSYKNMNNKKITVEIEDLWKRFDCPESYKTWNHFNKRVLKPSIKEINEKAGVNITYQPIKKKYNVHSICFDLQDINKEDDLKISSEAKNTDDEGGNEFEENLLSLLLSNGISKTQALQIAEKLYDLEKSVDWLKSKIDKICYRYKKSDIKASFQAYLYKAILSEIENLSNSHEDNKAHKSMIKEIRNNISNLNIKPNIDKHINLENHKFIKIYVDHGIITENEAKVILCSFSNDEYNRIYREAQDRHKKEDGPETDGYKIMCDLLFESLGMKLQKNEILPKLAISDNIQIDKH